MKFHLTQNDGHNLITAYADDFIEVNRQRYQCNLLVMPDQLFTDWEHLAGTPNDAIQIKDQTLQQQVPVSERFTCQSLTEAHFNQVLDLKPEVILLGTGKLHQFLHPSIYHHLTTAGISLECMTTAAACRTYNILMSEGRNVAAMLLM